MSQLNGVIIVTTTATPQRPLTGLHGITLVLDTAIAAKVIDTNGRGVPNVRLVQGSISVFTDANGNALAQFTAGNITLTKGTWSKTHTYSTGPSFTVLYDPPLLRF